MKALVVDDDVYCLTFACEYFKDKGFDVTARESPLCPEIQMELSSNVVDGPLYDVVLSDNRMPGMSGLEFFELIDKKNSYVPASCKALLTGDLTQEEFTIATKRGYKVFQKPCSLKHLDLWLNEVLG